MSSSEDSEGSSTSSDGLNRSLLRRCAPSIVITEELIVCSFCEKHLKTGRVGKKLSCGHIFHPGCILRSLARNRCCPTCGWDLTAAAAPHDRSENPNVAECSRNVNPPPPADEADEEPDPYYDDNILAKGPLSVLLGLLINTEITEVKLCVVCLKNLKPGDVGKKLPCNHVLHSHCVAHLYLKSHYECPHCRHEI